MTIALRRSRLIANSGVLKKTSRMWSATVRDLWRKLERNRSVYKNRLLSVKSGGTAGGKYQLCC